MRLWSKGDQFNEDFITLFKIELKKLDKRRLNSNKEFCKQKYRKSPSLEPR